MFAGYYLFHLQHGKIIEKTPLWASHQGLSTSSSAQLCFLRFNYTFFPGGSDSKQSACNAEDPVLIPGLGRFPEEENGNPLQYSYLENPTDRGASWATVHGVTKSQTGLSN